MKNNIFVGLAIFLIIVILLCLMYPTCKENFVAYSGYRATGCRDKNICKNYYLRHYYDCIEKSGGVDVRGDCWARTKPNLEACLYNPF